MPSSGLMAPPRMWIPALDQRGLLDAGGVLGLLDHAEQRAVARLVPADAAQIAFGDVAAFPAERDAFLRLHDRGGQPLRVLGVGLHQPERQPLRGLGPHAGQPRELVDQLLDGPS